MVLENTKIIRSISIDERINFFKDISNNSDKWSHHGDPRYTYLRDGQSLHIKRVNFDCSVPEVNLEMYPYTVEFIQSLCNLNQLGRAYWHRLSKGERILEHNDRDQIRKFGGRLKKRYQVYLDVPKDFILKLDDEYINPSTKYSNTFVDFNLRRNHFYLNCSEDPLYLLVFDVFDFL